LNTDLALPSIASFKARTCIKYKISSYVLRYLEGNLKRIER
jgi:hypothetical protein